MDREEAVNRNFPTVYRGLDEDEKIRQLEGMLDEKEENLNSFRNVETSINEAILTAQRAGDEDWDYLLDFDKNLEHRVDDLEAVEKKQDE